jgi:hypothetical protein
MLHQLQVAHNDNDVGLEVEKATVVVVDID